MTTRPTTIPQNPRDLTAEQALSEAIRILRNMGGPEYGAGIRGDWRRGWKCKSPRRETKGLASGADQASC